MKLIGVLLFNDSTTQIPELTLDRAKRLFNHAFPHFLIFLKVVLGVEPQALSMLCTSCTIVLDPQPPSR